MKLKRIITGSLLALTMAFGVGVGISANRKAEVKEAEAATSNMEIFINTAGIGDWESGAETMAWVSGDNVSSKWIMTTWINSNIRTFTLPAGFSTITLCRFSSSNHPADQSTYWWNDNWGQAWDFTPGDDLNYMSLTGWSDGKASYNIGYVKHFTSGETIYVDIQDCMSWWHDGYNTYVYMAVGNFKQWAQVSRIGSTNMYSVTFSSDFYADLMIVVRNNSASFDGKTNQSTDIVYTSGNASCNAIKLGGDDYGTTTVKGFETFSDAYVADSFGYYFLQLDLCKDAGGLSDKYSTEWAKGSSVYTSLKSKLSNQNYIKNASSSTDDNIGRALNRYDTAISKNYSTLSSSNFIGRSVSPVSGAAVSNIINAKQQTSSIIVVIVVSITAIAAAGFFFFFYKKKNQ